MTTPFGVPLLPQEPVTDPQGLTPPPIQQPQGPSEPPAGTPPMLGVEVQRRPKVPLSEQPFEIHGVGAGDSSTVKRQTLLRMAFEVNPDAVAIARQMAGKVGMSVQQVLENPAYAEALTAKLLTDDPLFSRRYPLFEEKLRDINFVPMVRDDIGNLMMTESAFEWFGRSYDVAAATSRIGTMGTRAMLTGTDLTIDEKSEYLRYQELFKAHKERELGFFAGLGSAATELAVSLVQTAGTAVALTAASAPVAGPAAPVIGGIGAFAQSFRLEAGNLWTQLVMEGGYTPAEATKISLIYGPVIAAVDFISMKGAVSPLKETVKSLAPKLFFNRAITEQTRKKAFAAIALNHLKGALGESAGEALQDVLAMRAEDLAQNLYKPWRTESNLDWGQVGDTFLHTFKGMMVIGAGSSTAYAVGANMRIGQAEHEARAMRRLAGIAEETKMASRSPEEHAAFMQNAADEAGNPTTYIPAKRFLEVLEKMDLEMTAQDGKSMREGLETLMPGIVEEAQKRAEYDGDLTIPTGEFMSNKWRMTTIGQELAQYARFDVNGSTVKELAELDAADYESITEDARKLAEESEAEQEVIVNEASDVRQRAYNQLRQTQRLTAEESQVGAIMLRQQVMRLARSAGMTPLEYLEANGPTVLRGRRGDQNEVAGEPFNQNDDSPTATPSVSDTSFQSIDGGGQARGEYSEWNADRTQRIRRVLLNKGANISTLLHELLHWNVQEMTRMAAEGSQDERLLKDVQTLFDFVGFADTAAEWTALTTEQLAPYHEAMASSYEIWLHEGKAPSIALRGVFSRITAWMRNLYHDIVTQLNDKHRRDFGVDLPGLTPEVRQVFERMVASHQDITAMTAVEGELALFQTLEEWTAMGRDPKEWERYRRDREEEFDLAVDELTRARLRDGEWLAKAKNRIWKELQRRHSEQRKAVEQDVRAEVALRPVNRLRSWIRSGIFLDEKGSQVSDDKGDSRRFDRATVAALVPGMVSQLNHYIAADGKGLSPDDVARQFYGESGTGESMLMELAVSPSLDEQVRLETDQRMLIEHSDLADPARQTEAVEAALVNEARMRATAAEIKALATFPQSGRVLLTAARQAAREAIRDLRIEQINVREFAAAARRARRDAAKLYKDGDRTAAEIAKRRELMASAMVSEAHSARSDIDKAMRLFRKTWQDNDRGNKRIGAVRMMGMVNAIRSMLGSFDIGDKNRRDPSEYLAEVREYDPTVYNEVAPMVEAAMDVSSRLRQTGRKWRQLTFGDFEQLRDTVKHLWGESKRIKNVELDGKRMSRDSAIAQQLTAINAEPKSRPGARNAWERLIDRAQGMWLSLRRMEHFAREVDNGDPRGITTRIVQHLMGARNQMNGEISRYSKRYREMVAALELGPNRLITAQELDGYVFGRGQQHAIAEIIGVILHTGNKSNLLKMIMGERGGFHVDQSLVVSRNWSEDGLVSFVNRMIREGHLKQSHFDFVQGVWDMNAELLPKAQAAHVKRYGTRFKEIKADPLQFDGVAPLQGGYVPARQGADSIKRHNSDEETLLADFYKEVASVEHGFAKDRVDKFARPLSYELTDTVSHISSVLRFIHMSDPVAMANRVWHSPEVERALQVKFGTKVFDNLIDPFLYQQAHQIGQLPPENPFTSMVQWISRSTKTAIMFGNVGNALQNPTGMVIAMREAGAANIASTARRVAMHYRETAKWATEEVTSFEGKGSKEMLQRMTEQAFDSQRKIKLAVLQPNKAVKMWTDLINNPYFLQTMTQNPTDLIVFTAMYGKVENDLLAKGVDPDTASKQAVRAAESLVRRTQMSNHPGDLSMFETGTLWASVVPFKGWFINWMNNTVTQAKIDMDGQTIESVANLATTYFFNIMTPLVLATLVADMAAGYLGDDDDELVDDLGTIWWRSQLDAVLASLPVVGDAAKVIINHFDDEVWNDRMPSVIWLQLAEKFAKSASSLEESRDYITMVSAMAAFSGIPVEAFASRIKYVVDVSNDRFEPGSKGVLPPEVDYWRGVLTGKAGASSRK